MTTKVTVLRHLSNEGIGSFLQVFESRGCEMTFINTPRQNISNLDALAPDFLVVMGGPIGVYQADEYPFLNDEIRILKDRIEADLPTLGVCLGSQLIAKAAGSNVYAGEQAKERGWGPLRLNGSAMNTPFEHLGGQVTNMFHWHGDTFDLPAEAKLLASTEAYKNQIFTLGKNICGLQCHPEVTADALREWMVMLVGEVAGADAEVPLAKLRADTQEHAFTLKTQTAKFLNAWMDEKGI
jgi:GMP synthase (glutamine-hydrolysing)